MAMPPKPGDFFAGVGMEVSGTYVVVFVVGFREKVGWVVGGEVTGVVVPDTDADVVVVSWTLSIQPVANLLVEPSP